MHNDETPDDELTADAALILRTRSGDREAFGELWRRHYPSGMAVARSITSSIDPDDLVQESYTRIYQAIVKGGGPNGSVRAYRFTSIRNTAAAWGRARRETAMDELDAAVDPDSTEQAANEALDRGLTAQAFRSLPTRWQEVLWYTEIEQMKPAAVAPLLGMKAGAVSQLAFRAREGLREAWITAHLRSAAEGSECHWTIEHLGAHARGNLSARDQKRLDAHLAECARCLIVAAEAKDVSNRLALVLLPLVLGVAGAAGYTAMLQTGGVPVVALAAMPSSIVEGAVVAGGAEASGGLIGAVPAGFGKSTGGAAGSSGGTTGAVGGIGALVGAGSAALVVAGVVVAATVAPGIFSATPVTSLPNAGDADSSNISSEVVPEDGLDQDDKFVLEIDEELPIEEDPHDVAPDDIVTDDTADEATIDQSVVVPVIPAPTPSPTPTDPVDPEEPGTDPGDGGGGDPGTDPEEPVDPTDPTDPGTDPDPGEGEGETDPGEGGTDPVDPEPVDPEPVGPEPVAPTEAVAISGTDVIFDTSTGKTHVVVSVSGQAGETVQAYIDGSTSGSGSVVLDANGQGTIDLRPTGRQIILSNRVNVTFQYTAYPEAPLQSSTLSALILG